MTDNRVRQPHAQQPLPIDHVIRMANRLSLKTLMMVVAYTAVLLSSIAVLHWLTLPLAIVCAFGIYHARLQICAADYYDRQLSPSAAWIWPLRSMGVAIVLLAIAGFCLMVGMLLGFALTCGLACLTNAPEEALMIASLISVIPGFCLGVLLASLVVANLGKRWLKLL